MSDANGDVRSNAGQIQVAQNDEARKSADTTKPPQTSVQNSPQHKRFFDQLHKPLSDLATRLGVPESYIIGLPAYESGYLDDHNQALNNPFGLTHGGGNNLNFPTVDDAVKNWEKLYGQQVKGATSPEDFVGRLQGKLDGNPVNGWDQQVLGTINSIGRRTQAWKNGQ
jgi:hypothetical protein